MSAGPGVPVWTYNDYWGTFVSVFDLPEPHDDLVIRAVSTVETEPFGGPAVAGGRPSWAQIGKTAAGSRLLEFLLPTPLTTVAEPICAAALAEIGGRSPDAAAQAVCTRVHEHVAYLPGATGVRTNAQEAWDQGKGVCQDMAQIAVALLRAAGLPARYVSGYLHPDPDAEPGSTATGQSHAWVEYWAGSWTPLDPTSLAQVGERHVVVARGRDYARRPAAQGHLPRPLRRRHDGDGGGHPPRLAGHHACPPVNPPVRRAVPPVCTPNVRRESVRAVVRRHAAIAEGDRRTRLTTRSGGCHARSGGGGRRPRRTAGCRGRPRRGARWRRARRRAPRRPSGRAARSRAAGR